MPKKMLTVNRAENGQLYSNMGDIHSVSSTVCNGLKCINKKQIAFIFFKNTCFSQAVYIQLQYLGSTISTKTGKAGLNTIFPTTLLCLTHLPTMKTFCVIVMEEQD